MKNVRVYCLLHTIKLSSSPSHFYTLHMQREALPSANSSPPNSQPLPLPPAAAPPTGGFGAIGPPTRRSSVPITSPSQSELTLSHDLSTCHVNIT